MASAQSIMKLFANLGMALYDHDPDANTALIVSPDAGTTLRYIDMRDCNNFAAIAMSSALTGAGITLLEIVASETITFAAVTVIKTSGAVVCDAVGDYVVEECTAEEVGYLAAAAGLDLRYVAARITVANAADEAVVAYVEGNKRWAYSGLTADTIS